MLLAQVLLSGNTGGEAVTFLTARISPLRAFALLRRLSGLTLCLPRDIEAVSLLSCKDRGVFEVESEALASAGTSRWLRFPRFREVLGTVERVQCFFLCRRLGSRKEVADRLGWSEEEVRKVDDTLRKRLRHLKGIAW